MSKLKFLSFIMSNRVSTILGLVFIVTFVASLAYAQGNDDTIHACANPVGQLRVVESEENCRPKETYLDWNAVGPQGPVGPKGDKGDPGDFSGVFEWKMCSRASTDHSTGSLRGACIAYPWESEFPSPPEEYINGFTPISREVAIESINLLVIQRSGSFNGSFTMTFEVRDFNGEIQHIVSSSDIDLLSAPIKDWIAVSLSSNSDELVVSPGEYLSVHVVFNGEAPEGEGFDLRPAFEVIVRDTGN